MQADEEKIRRAAAEALLSLNHPRWSPLPHQVPPTGDWRGWLLLGGRGSGKSDACSKFIADHVQGPPCINGPAPHWIGIIAPTLGDAATSCFYGPSGIRTHDPTAKLTGGAGGMVIKWPNGSEAKLFGAREPEDVERLRSGGNRCLVWLEEFAAWRYMQDCWDHMRFGLRAGKSPRWIGATTPKPRPLIKKIMDGEFTGVVVTRATTHDNPHLPLHIREALEDTYGNRRLGRQELYAEWIEQDENALWNHEMLDETRVNEAPHLIRISVGVDPSGGAGEQGIVVVGKSQKTEIQHDGKPKIIYEGYTISDRSCNLSPNGWGRRAVQAAVDFEADDIVVETNFGGDMAMATISGAAEAMGVVIPVRKVTASRGKRVRAEPVAALYERNLWHHVGRFAEMETQMCTWTEESDYSPDRLDANVWPGWHMRLVSTISRGMGSFPGSQVARTSITGSNVIDMSTRQRWDPTEQIS